MKEKNAFHVNGYLGLLLTIIGAILGAGLVYFGMRQSRLWMIIIGGLILLVVLICCTSLTIIQPITRPRS